eukprot:gene2378-biopygen18528
MRGRTASRTGTSPGARCPARARHARRAPRLLPPRGSWRGRGGCSTAPAPLPPRRCTRGGPSAAAGGWRAKHRAARPCASRPASKMLSECHETFPCRLSTTVPIPLFTLVCQFVLRKNQLDVSDLWGDRLPICLSHFDSTDPAPGGRGAPPLR